LLWIPPLLFSTAQAAQPVAVVKEAARLSFPGVVHDGGQDGAPDGNIDCNSPAHWDGGVLYMFYSTGHPYRSQGSDLQRLSRPSKRVAFDNEKSWLEAGQGARWIEATHKAADGKLYMWYHNEPPNVCQKGKTAPRIGQMVSADNGMNWRDQGLILEAPADSLNCDSPNHYFRGGNGDFSVIPDREKAYVYFFISTYHRDVAEQGVSVARMKYADLENPKGKVYKWYQGAWAEAGLGGHVTPFIPVGTDWHRPDADAFWGPSIHWNTHLEQWVILLNRAKDKSWAQDGIYASFNPDLSGPNGWSRPVKILDARGLPKSKWYPQVVGTNDIEKGTDKLAGKKARLFVAGQSRWEIEFYKPTETQPAG